MARSNRRRRSVHRRRLQRAVSAPVRAGLSNRPGRLSKGVGDTPMNAALRGLRRVLDFIYLASGILAALCLIAILLLIVAQMVARWTGEIFPGAAQYAGYAMAAASFFAFANALNRGAHIRVSLVLNAVPTKARRFLEIWC